ncbi:MAG: CotH kinase family protein, partial [Clostridia bacterium]
ANAIVQIGNEIGPIPGEIGFGATEPNATINVRGRTSTTAAQKSYRLSFFDNAGLWRGQRDIALSKHPNDPTRLRNALYFRFLQDVPGMVSLRTQFVHLYIKDETSTPAAESFVDYGLFTQVELPNNRFLRNHGLSRDSHLYKANMFEFFRYPEVLKLATDPTYDLAAFSAVLEPKINEDLEKLLAMLDAVNDYDQPIEAVVEKYFDMENLTSFLAYNILMGNVDTNTQNFFLYNPVNSDRWYFICWDGDGSLAYSEFETRGEEWPYGEWARGISNYWGEVLFARLLRVDHYRDLLSQKMELLHNTITPARLAQQIAQYRTVVDPFTTRMPDAIHMQMEHKQRELVYQRMANDVEIGYQGFRTSLQKPMPFFLGEAKAENGQLQLHWDSAYDFTGKFVRYTVELATDWSFAPETIVWKNVPTLELSAATDLPLPGMYFWRVIATNESGYSQSAFDFFESSTGRHPGMRRFTVDANGTVNNLQ